MSRRPSISAAIPFTRHNVVMETHRLCHPMQKDWRANLIPVTLPDRVAQMYLDMSGEWDLPPLAGISTAPLLSRKGAYERQTAITYFYGTARVSSAGAAHCCWR